VDELVDELLEVSDAAMVDEEPPLVEVVEGPTVVVVDVAAVDEVPLEVVEVVVDDDATDDVVGEPEVEVAEVEDEVPTAVVDVPPLVVVGFEVVETAVVDVPLVVEDVDEPEVDEELVTLAEVPVEHRPT